MSSVSDSKPIKIWKTKKFWFLIIFALYSAFGWLGVPYIVKQQAINTLKDMAQWDVRIESVVFNPYAFSLAIHSFEAIDQFEQGVVSFDRLLVNFSPLGSLSGHVAFDEISLNKPIVSAQLDKQGLSNFERDFSSQSTENETIENSDTEPLALFFTLISISNGQIDFSDHRAKEVFSLSIEPINLSLRDFSTNQNDGGEHSLSLSLGEGQDLNWQGRIGIAPFSSTGSLTLSKLKSSSFWHYAKPFSPYALQNVLISFDASYDTEFSDQTSRFNIDTGSVRVEEIALAQDASSDPFFNLESVNLNSVAFNLEEKTAKLGTLAINTPYLQAIKNENALINLLQPLEEQQSDNEKVATNSAEITTDSDTEVTKPNTAEVKQGSKSTDAEVFKWSVAGIELNKGRLNWKDLSLESPADLTIESMDLSLSTISHELDKPFSYKLSFVTGEAPHSLSGNLSPQPFNVDGDMQLGDLPLSWFQPYIGEQANIILEQGYFDLDTRYQLALNDVGLSGTVSADTSIRSLTFKDNTQNQALTGLKGFTISGFDLSLEGQSPPTIIIEEIKLSQPFAKARISEQGEMNLAQITKESENKEAAPTQKEADISESEDAESQVSQSESDPAANITIKNILIEEGRFDYIDASLDPVFTTYIEQFSGNIQNISSDIDARSKVSLSGNLDTFGNIAIDGTTNPLSTNPNTSLAIKVSNIDLTTISPYSAKFAGYLIDKGKLDLDLEYNIEGSKLNANNEVFIDQFNFGDSVDSPDATALPLPLAIGIMKNLDGEIDIDLPISGDLSDPSFSIGGVLITAFTNLITKIVTSPFSMLSSLVEGSDDISAVDFKANTHELDPAQAKKILKLAEALKKRPNLSLEVRGVADESLDLDTNAQALNKDELTLLAKNRALSISKVLIEQGGIKEERVFTLEPKVIASTVAPDQLEQASVSSIFTVKVD